MTILDEHVELRDRLADRYRLERELGRGGMATVYLAEDLKHGRRVALKVLRVELAAALGRERFVREIALTARLQHANILPVLDSGETAAQLWYTMPYVDGESLRAQLTRQGQLALDVALRIVREVADALGYAHDRDVVHRDVKPENILLAGGHAFVADFGIARALDDAGGEKLTQTGVGLGTPHYMSPEQSLGDDRVDGRTDIYALGCVLYEMLAGERPYDGPNAQAIIAKRLSQPVPSVRVLRETVPSGIEQALVQAMAKSPADRFETTAEFVAALSVGESATVGGVSGVVRDIARTSKRSGAVWMTSGALVVAVAAAGAWAVTRNSSGSAIDPAAGVIAVMPIVPASNDTALARLGRDLAGSVSATLDGIGDIRTVDRLTVLAQVPEHRTTPLPLSEAAALARRLGASSVVHGSVGRDGQRVRLDVSLFTTDSLTPIARATVTAGPDDLTALTDSVVWSLLGDIWRTGRPPTPSLAAITTRSVPALRAFLDGERYLVAGDGDQAHAAFSRAIAADSTFWFAYYRKGNAMGWAEQEVDSLTEATYRAHRDRLPLRERMVIAASRPDSGFTRQRAQLLEIVARYPDYWPAWWMLGDNLHHIYPQQIGVDPEDTRRAFERVVELNPSMVYTWQHLGQVYSDLGDSAGLARVLQNLDRLDGRGVFIKGERTDHVMLLRIQLELMRGGQTAPALLDSLYDGVIRGRLDPWLPSNFLNFAGRGAQQIALNERLLRHGLERGSARWRVHSIADAWAMRGAWDSALVTRDRFASSASDTSWALDTYRMTVAGVWVGALTAQDTIRRRANAYRLAAAQGSGYVAELAWLDGVLAAATDDERGLAAARERVRGSKASWAARLDRSLDAFGLAMRGDTRRAASTMAALEWEIGDADPWFMFRPSAPHVYLTAIDRMAAAEWSASTGDTTQALRLLTWRNAASAPVSEKVHFAPLAYLLTARIREGQRDTTAAVRAYEQFLLRFDAPVPALQHLVREAREAVDRLDRAVPLGDRARSPTTFPDSARR